MNDVATLHMIFKKPDQILCALKCTHILTLDLEGRRLKKVKTCMLHLSQFPPY